MNFIPIRCKENPFCEDRADPLHSIFLPFILLHIFFYCVLCVSLIFINIIKTLSGIKVTLTVRLLGFIFVYPFDAQIKFDIYLDQDYFFYQDAVILFCT